MNRARHSSRLDLRLTLLIPGAMSVVLTGCSGGSETSAGSPVASVDKPAGESQPASPGGAAPAAGNSAEVEARRPRLRVDSTDAEQARLLSAWANCLGEHGVQTYSKKDDTGLQWVFPEDWTAEDDPQAAQACAAKEPIRPAATDPKRNPDYANDFRNYVKCINRESDIIKVRQTGDGWTYAEGSDAPEEVHTAFMEIDRACEIEAFGGE